MSRLKNKNDQKNIAIVGFFLILLWPLIAIAAIVGEFIDLLTFFIVCGAFFYIFGGLYYLFTEQFSGVHLMIVSSYILAAVFILKRWTKSVKK